MSDIINELQGSFEDTNKQLSKLSSDLSKLTKFEDNLSKAGESLESFTQKYTKIFLEDLEKLNIEFPENINTFQWSLH